MRVRCTDLCATLGEDPGAGLRCRAHGTWLALFMLVTMKADGNTWGGGLLYVLYYWGYGKVLD
jgi:hypothetical protein